MSDSALRVSNMSKPRVLIISYTIPKNKMGGGLLLYRHFVAKRDFEIGVVTNSPDVVPNVFCRQVPEPRLLCRLKKTRLNLWMEDYTHLVHSRFFDRRLLKAAEEFKPDLIFNVAETYLSYQACALARRLRVPFVAYFMDWAHFAARSHGWAVPHMDRMYRQLYRDADLAFCICDGMKAELGPHPNAHVLHPIGTDFKMDARGPGSARDGKFTFCFAGNLNSWYGRMVRDLMIAGEGEPSIGMKVFGAHHNWPDSFVSDQTTKGVFGGFRPFDQLIPEFQNADAFLLPMGFDSATALIERTSFKTKLLDYIVFEKPILVWGPEYSTAVKIARQYDCALCVTDPNPHAAMAAMKALAGNLPLQRQLVGNTIKMREADLNHERVYGVLKTGLERLLKPSRA